MNMTIQEKIQAGLVFFDGGTGTMLQEAGLAPGGPANLAVWDLESAYAVDPADFLSMGKASPFTGWQVRGRCLLTLAGGEIAYRAEENV